MPTITQAARIVRKKTRKAKSPRIAVCNEDSEITLPEWVRDINSFRRWIDSDEVPENHKIWWLHGEVWIDMSNEQLFNHVRLKTHLAAVLSLLVDEIDLGVFFGDGAHLTNLTAEISGNPDSLFVSHESFRSGAVKRIEGKKRGYVELEGSPDMVIEVMSDSSVKKDMALLHDAYAFAGIREYWLVDAREEPLRFEIYRLTRKGYTAGRKQDGWIKSAAFNKSFRLVEVRDGSGNPKYQLEIRSV
jgi:Uma2 family endonuclease